jgi:hypothetical protein
LNLKLGEGFEVTTSTFSRAGKAENN